jgi:hypothetical protein
MDEQEASPFLLAYDGEKPHHFVDTKNKQLLWRIRGLQLHLCLIFIYTLVFLIATTITIQKVNRSPHELIYTPAGEAVTWTKQTVYNPLGLKTHFNGPPSPEIDEAWGKLIQHSNIKVSADELRKLNKSSIKLQDGSGMYFSNLGVHHHLHCLVITPITKKYSTFPLT